MKTHIAKPDFESALILRLKKIPAISRYAATRGWAYLISWTHRITGIVLVFSLWAYVCALNASQSSRGLFLYLLLWILAVPMIFHGLNGARLILYEFFGNRGDEAMIRWVLALSLIYLFLLGTLMIMGNQTVTPFFYWAIILPQALIAAYGVAVRTLGSRHSFLWKMQRTSGAFLLFMVPAYFLYIPLNSPPEMAANLLITGIQGFFLKSVYVLLLFCALFHGGYGIWSVTSDYLGLRNLRKGLAALAAFITLIFAWIGLLATLGL